MDNARAIVRFGQEMFAEIEANKSKGNWQVWNNPTEWIGEILHHITKLIRALNSGDNKLIREYCADIANLAMFVAYNSGALESVDDK